jgi:hypothetical protein
VVDAIGRENAAVVAEDGVPAGLAHRVDGRAVGVENLKLLAVDAIGFPVVSRADVKKMMGVELAPDEVAAREQHERGDRPDDALRDFAHAPMVGHGRCLADHRTAARMNPRICDK